jgi:hypothetical protein
MVPIVSLSILLIEMNRLTSTWNVKETKQSSGLTPYDCKTAEALLEMKLIVMVSAQNVQVTDEALIVDLSDARTVSVPLAWFPRLLQGTPEERNKWRLIGDGEGIHWPELDEDISVENLILGKPSGESQRSFKKWLEARSKG